MFCKQSFSLPSEPCTPLLQLTESGACPTAHMQELQRWQVCSLCHLSAVGTERPLKIGACKVCFWIKLVRLQKNILKNYIFLHQEFCLHFFYCERVPCESANRKPVHTKKFVTEAAVCALLVLSAAALGQTLRETTEVFSWLDFSRAVAVI